jgi:hypothetical protein
VQLVELIIYIYEMGCIRSWNIYDFDI